MDKTALQQAIDDFKYHKNENGYSDPAKWAFGKIVEHLESLLPKEKEQLEDAFIAGEKLGKEEGRNVPGEELVTYSFFSEYYAQTYGADL
jgi:hypothetical protein